MSKNRCIKWIAMLLSVIMMMNMMPVAAFAYDEPVDTNTSLPKDEDIKPESIQYAPPSESSSDEMNGGSPDGSSGGTGGSTSLQYKCGDETVSMTEGDPDPNKDYTIQISFDPGTAKAEDIFDLQLTLGYVSIKPEDLPKSADYTCKYDPNSRKLTFQWNTLSRPGFAVSIPCKPAFPEPDGWSFTDSYAIVAKTTNAMMVPVKQTQTNKRNVIQSASCTVFGNQIRNNDLVDTTSY